MAKISKFMLLDRIPQGLRKSGAVWGAVGAVFVGVVWVAGTVPEEDLRFHAARGSNSWSVRVPPAPLWLSRNIPEDLTKDLERVGLLEQPGAGIAQKVYHQLADHPWVENVERVTTRFPTQLWIDVSYREPRCIVPTPGDPAAIDSEGFLLPLADIHPEWREKLYVATGVQLTRLPPAGEAIRDGRLLEAARLAKFLGPRPAQAGFRYIRTEVRPRLLEPEEFVLWLQDDFGRVILWGHPPEAEIAGEPLAARKLQILLDFLSRSDSVESAPGVVLSLAEDNPSLD